MLMVIKTETLTSTLHHDIFTYLDYIFPATFILSDFIHIYFHIYIYIYIYIYIDEPDTRDTAGEARTSS